MKKVVLIFVVFVSFVCHSQVNGNFLINWVDNSTYASDNFNFKIPNFQVENFSFDSEKKAIQLSIKLPISNFLDENSIKITNPVFETVSAEQLGDLNLKNIPKQISATSKNIKARNKSYNLIVLSPIVKENNIYKRLKSFSYTISKSNTSVSNRGFNTLSNSVLKSGDWYRFYVEKSGIYKITKSFLQQLGMNLNNVNPQNIKIFGGGASMLPLSNSVAYPSDLTENPIEFIGESDGQFDNQDYILMYAEGFDNWDQENETHLNLYATRSYYYVNAAGNAGKRIPTMPFITDTNTTKISTFDEYQFHEKDLINIGRLDRKYFGEQFGFDDKYSFDFEFPNIVTNAPITITVAGGAVAFTPTKIDVAANGTNVAALNFNKLTPNDNIVAIGNDVVATLPASTNVKIELKYDNNGVAGSKGFLDYIVLNTKSNLKGWGRQFPFQYNDAITNNTVGEFQISNASSITEIWDITDIYDVTKYENQNLPTFTFKANLGEIRKYIALDNNDFYTPKKESVAKVLNQDLKGTVFKNAANQFQDIDYIIITPAFLNTQAEKLANFHRQRENFNVKVINLENIYQEFSSGKQDIGAIRNFIKYVYRNASSEDKKLKYVNLFGDASFDFKNRIPNKSNIVPIYHSLASFSLLNSFISDDFFVLLDDNEGDMNPSFSFGLDVAVGRMIVNNVAQAEEMVNKVVEYEDTKSYGRWRNNFVLISDDVDKSGEQALEKGIDALGDELFAQKPFINVKKIHTDSYIQETSAGGNRYPKGREDFVNTFEQGALVFDYFGHGGEDGLAQERILEKSDAQNLTNRYKYPLFVTITCEFTRFDNPYKETAGEYMYWNPKGGAISLITTTRQIFLNVGQDINEAIASNLFGYGTNNLDSMAEALRKSKEEYGKNTLMVFYIGDPALKLAIPKPKIILTKINDVPVGQNAEDLKALSVIKLTGEIRDETGNSVLSNYNGDLAVNIFDKPIDRTTLGNDGLTDSNNNLITMNFKTLGETIFRGNASVKNGLFEFTFIVPKDIRVPVGKGRISFYAKETGELIDQTGFDTSIIVGGINNNAAADEVAPTVKLYMNDTNFVNGGITNESPILLAFLNDENGINTASGIGHDIIGILDGDETKPFILNDYYETETDNYKKGKLKFQLRNLKAGLHTMTFIAWDVYNNKVTSEIQFIVVGDETLTLKNVLNYPNPFVNYTQFWFTHNRPLEPLEVQVQVMTVTGKVVWTKNQLITTDGFLSREITWDGKDDFGDKIGKGVYVYKLTVKSTLTNKKTEKFEKLVIL